MTTDPKRTKEIFLGAVELADETARAAYLDRACGGDDELRARVEALLRSHDPAGSFLGTPAAVIPDPASDHTSALDSSDLDAGSPRPDSEDESDELQFLTPPRRPDSLGRLGHYEVFEILGKGGFGIVFRAFDETLQRVVAIKVLSAQLAATSPARKRFLREARSSAKVRHENVVQIYGVEEQPLPYLVMEFIPGETLQQRLDRVGPVEPAEVVRIGHQLAEGLAAAHATYLIHRDIKPGNILLEGVQLKPKITDFGLARAADDASLSQSGIIAGTPMYMAPEQANGEKLDQRADLFSLGSVLYQMVSGRPPFRADSTLAVLKRVADDTPRDIREIIPETPQWLCDIIAKLHAKKPAERFQSAREVADLLADCEAQLSATSKLKDLSRIPRSKQPAAGKSGRWKWVAAAVLLLPVLALALSEFAGVTRLFRDREALNKTPTPVSIVDGPEFTNTLGMKFRLIPAGKFTMGSSPQEINRCLELVGDDAFRKERIRAEGPEHEVEISQPFYMGTTEVTGGQFRQFMKANPKYNVGDDRPAEVGLSQSDDHPAGWVSWHHAVDFCVWLSEKEGKKYRLPTEAEWEYCCRAGQGGTRYCCGDDDAHLENYGWYAANSGHRLHSVGKKKPNDWGLYDMHGNIWEWCHDDSDAKSYPNGPVIDPRGPGAGLDRVIRGGGAESDPASCRSAYRHHMLPNFREFNTGFRVLLVSPPSDPRPEGGAKE